MGRLVHFEIHVNDMDRAKKFYGEVFGWSFQDWSEYAGMPYFGAVTGNENEPGIDGALMQRQGQSPETNQAVNAFVCTLGVEDYDTTDTKLFRMAERSQCLNTHCLEWLARILFGYRRKYIWNSSTRQERKIEIFITKYEESE